MACTLKRRNCYGRQTNLRAIRFEQTHGVKMITIKHRFSGATLCEFDVGTVKQAPDRQANPSHWIQLPIKPT